MILNCSNWQTDPDCIEVQGDLKRSMSSGDFNHDPSKSLYFLTMNMMEDGREFLFSGAVLNSNLCLKGRYGPFCQECPIGTYKSIPGVEECSQCPCDSTSTQTGLTSIRDCSCQVKIAQQVTLFKIVMIFFVFMVFLTFFHIIMKKKKKYEDKNYLSDLRYKVNDIPNSYGRIYVSGSNTPNQPWKIERLDPELANFFQAKNFNQFREVRQPYKITNQ